MNTFKKLALAATSVVGLGFASANAAVVVSDGNGNFIDTSNSATGPTLGAGTAFALNFDENDLVNGQSINETISFVIGPDVDDADVSLGVLPASGQQNGAQAGIANFMAMIFVNGTGVATLQITDALGRQDLDNSFFELMNLAAGDQVEIQLMGVAFEFRGDDAEYSVNVFGNAAPVPVPAAGLLFGTALAGGFAARRRKA